MIEQTTWRGQKAVALSGDGLRLTLLPDLGAKIVSIVDQDANEYIWQSDGEYRLPEYGSPFDTWDVSGWDECFPTVAACTLASGPWAGVTAPCHGEVWSLPHQVIERDGALTTRVHGVRFPYTFERTIRPAGPAAWRLDYRVVNQAALELPYLYSAHPLLRVSPGTRLLLPNEVRWARVDNSLNHRVGALGDTLAWPRAVLPGGATVDLGEVVGAELSAGDKLYSEPPGSAGWCGLVDPVRQVVCGFRFDPAELPRVGIWQNQGWQPGQLNVALEPCSGYPDRLDLALARGEARRLPAGGEATWSLTFVASPGGEARLRELLIP
ncbi:MAG: hypothetical protein HUU35_10500 [Armatimonadetes bacterium]|nr:hypothetical protein [Armatimonadota bacterium]